MTNVLALPAGTELVGDYRIERVLGVGGFGITYLAEELALARLVTIKEYFPSDFAARGEGHSAVPRSQESADDYHWGLNRFIDEAQALALFDHRNIVRVYRYFRANSTAYMVLHFEEGASLKNWLKDLGRAPRQRELDKIVVPLLDALELIHNQNFLHRDIAPDNIIIRTDGSPVLIDFGSARGEVARHTRTVSALVKPGYSPYEQYAETAKQQGPWTDIYALAATLYHAVTGKRPPDAPTRVVKDELVPARDAAIGAYRKGFLAAIDRGLALDIDKRPPTIAAWRGDLLAPDPAQPGWLRRVITRDAGRPAGREAGPSAPASQPTVVPPPPDVPDRQGGLLDFIDGLRKDGPRRSEPTEPKPEKSEAGVESAPPAAAPPPPKARSAEPAKCARRKAVKRARPAPSPGSEHPAPAKFRPPPRPRAVRAGETWRWRPLLFKLLIGVGIAGAAIGMQGRIPSQPLDARGSGVIASATGSEAASISRIEGHRGGTTAVAFTDDGGTIVTTGADGTLRLWNAATGALTRTLELDDGPATSLAVLGRRALTGHTDGSVAMWDLDRGDKLGRYRRNQANIWSVAFAGDPTHFLASSHDWAIALWDARTVSEPLHVFEAHESSVQAVAFTERGPYIASGSADRTVKLWSPVNLAPIRTYRGHRDFVTALAFSPDGKLLASADLDGSIRLWSTSSTRLYRILSGHVGRITGIAFSPGGEVLASAGEDGTVRLWDYRRSRPIRTHAGPVAKSLAFSPDGRRLAVASAEGSVQLWSGVTALRAKE
ncbi:MAG TPA: serine/threonine-protein kinase [Hyphomicrobiaceae bacterium]|nr:serine/threonine-protein kinase [Hyphomicrobiaceae bacterium]